MTTYFPVLKTKQAEYQALDKFEDWSDSIRPIFEVIPRPDRTQVLQEQAWYAEVAAAMLGYAKSAPVLIDPHAMNARDDRCTTQAFFRELESLIGGSSETFHLIPCVRLDASPEEISAAARLSIAANAGAGLRVTAAEIAAAGLDGGNQLSARLDSMRSSFGISRSEIDLVLDLGQMTEEAEFYVGNLTLIVPTVTQGWRHVAVVGTTGPTGNDVAGFAQAETPRTEFEVWRKLVGSVQVSGELEFGDYVGFPAELPTGNGRTRHPSLRYTTRLNSYLVRRRAERGEGFAVYEDVCSFVVSQSWFSGDKYSWGDEEIAAVASGVREGHVGNATSWRASSVNHHMVLTSDQLASYLEP